MPGAVGEVEITERIEGMEGKLSAAVCSMSRQTLSHSSLKGSTQRSHITAYHTNYTASSTNTTATPIMPPQKQDNTNKHDYNSH